MKKTILRITGFFLLLFLALGIANRILEFKHADGIAQMEQFYKQDKNTVDVIILGSSHSFVNFSNATLWEKYGMASYDLGGSAQPLWNTYNMLKEVLKTQTPELIVLEGYGVTFDYEYSDDARVIKNLHGMRWSINKLEAYYNSCSLGKLGGVLLDYRQYHTRYAYLQKGDFMKDPENQIPDYNWFDEDWKGQYLFNISNPIELPDVSGVDYVSELSFKSQEYYCKIMELAREKEIPIVVVIAPFQGTEYEQSLFLRAEEIAQEYGVNFLNVYEKMAETDIDPLIHFYDDCHMTAVGADVFSTYVGAYLKEHYTISDRRGDKKYDSWERHAQYVNEYIMSNK